jgi:hypothetical protein
MSQEVIAVCTVQAVVFYPTLGLVLNMSVLLRTADYGHPATGHRVNFMSEGQVWLS